MPSPEHVSSLPRPEYPRPQFQRADWVNLNGTWTFALDPGQSGMERGFAASSGFDRVIIVPFCPESELSGVCHTDFIAMMWYHRKLNLPEGWQGKRIILHFGAVDYESEVFVDGKSVGRHWGGTASFSYDITRCVTPGQSHDLVVCVRDDIRSGVQPSGKQIPKFKSYDAFYTRTTGIWQTVWMEAVDPHALQWAQIVPDLDGSRFIITPSFYAVQQGLTFRAILREGSRNVSLTSAPAVNGVPLIVPVSHPKAWSPETPFLYDLDLDVLDQNGAVLDHVAAYAGLRKVHIEGNRLFLNNQPIFLRLVLDQGFYPDGIWTAPSDADLKHDILLAMKAGFNGARLHQKVFEARFHYWADKLGYLTWAESASWGMDMNDTHAARNFLSEWREIVCRDRSHPSIIAWTPFDQTSDTIDRRQHHRLQIDAYELTHSLDPTRPVNDASVYAHARTDLWTVHMDELSPETLAEQLALNEGQPYIVGNFGGIQWIPLERRPNADNTLGHGEGPRSLNEFYARLEGQVKAIDSFPHITGYCYTQLTDVEQQQNGIYNEDRTEKFDMARIARIFNHDH